MQRWDDHRYYHHSRINQSLHLLSAICFVIAYGMLPFDPAMAAILAWCVSMTSRQAGHFFFEPRGYDEVNQATDEYKEEIKVGYNIRRKIVLMSVWVLIPLTLWFQPSLFGLIEPASSLSGFAHDMGIAWLALGIRACCFASGSCGSRPIDHRAGLDDEDPDRPVPRHQALSQGAVAPAARRADRPDGARAPSLNEPQNHWRSISATMPRLIARLLSAESSHHQPSSCMSWAASMKRSSTVSKSWSL